MLNYLSVKIVIWSFLVKVESLVVFLYFLGENIKAKKRYLELKDVCQHMFMEIAEKKWEESFSNPALLTLLLQPCRRLKVQILSV